MTEARILASLRSAYEDLDRSLQEFTESTGLSCPPGCGQCCENPAIHATALECLLLGAAALDGDRVEDLTSGTCAFYLSQGPGRGRCTAYRDRPLVCRLFGFASRRDRHGTAQLDRCPVHEAAAPEAHRNARERAEQAPMYPEWSMRVRGILPASLHEERPINLAVREAAEFLYWKRRSESDRQDT